MLCNAGSFQAHPSGGSANAEVSDYFKALKLKLLLKDVLLTSARLPSLSATPALVQRGGGIAAKLSWKEPADH